MGWGTSMLLYMRFHAEGKTMTSEILMHIDEDLTPAQREELLRSLGNRPEGMHAHLQARQPHMMFVAFDPDELCPHELVEIAEESGVHAQVIDL